MPFSLKKIDSAKLKAELDTIMPELELVTRLIPTVGPEASHVESLLQTLVDNDDIRGAVVDAANTVL